MSTFCEKEFMLKNFWFDHHRPVLFVSPQFGPHTLYPVWTMVQLLYHIIAVAIDGYQSGQHDGQPTGHYFLYLPNWTYLLLLLSSLIDCVATVYVHCLARYFLEEREKFSTDAAVTMRNRTIKISYKTMGKHYVMKFYLKISWLFFTLSTVAGLSTSIMYWTFYFIDMYVDIDHMNIGMNAAKLGENTKDYGTLAFSFINALVILIHLTITAKPFRLLHFYLPVAFFGVYFAFSAIYQHASGEYIYQIFDWDQVFYTTGLVWGIVLILVPLVHLFVFTFVYLRTKLGTFLSIWYAFHKWKKKKVVPLEPEVDTRTNVIRWINAQSPHGDFSRKSKDKHNNDDVVVLKNEVENDEYADFTSTPSKLTELSEIDTSSIKPSGIGKLNTETSL